MDKTAVSAKVYAAPALTTNFTDMAPEDRVRLEQFLAVAGNPQSPDSINQNQRQEES